MRFIRILFIVIWVLSLNLPLANASEEDFANWRTVQIEFGSLGQAGPASLNISSGTDGIEKFQLNAFGKTFSLKEADLKKLAGFPLHSLEVTHEAGYEILGGYSVHIKLYRVNAKSQRDTAIITFQKNKDPSVGLTPAPRTGIGN